MKVLILTTVHRWNDPRVFHKQACTLARQHEVTLAAVDSGPERDVDGVHLKPLGIWKTRFDRPKLWWKAYITILKSKADIVHFHDPELALILLPYALVGNKKLVCDIHEHPTAAIGGRQWIPKIIRKATAFLFGKIITLAPNFFDEVILAEDSYIEHFSQRSNIHVIKNFAILPSPDLPYTERYDQFDPAESLRLIYIGSVVEERGALIMAEALLKLLQRFPGTSLDLIGKVRPPELEIKLKEIANRTGNKLRLHGYLDLIEAGEILQKAHIGLIPLQPHPNFEGSFATKFYDYMTYGLPIIATDFPIWKRFLAENSCGIAIDATEPDQLVSAITELAEQPDQLEAFSKSGYAAVREKYSWEDEGEKLLDLYSRL
ncbi:hypothetical protein CEE37_06700 [candidate division LCP-89 bacterium B3_LCP]|uniref:Glycosyltransferase subfamily 4-like N-terminal domain-containing protein n=1 Tax=candidate division LCP-89 bacterium B3_LCP TaxID=2012998 RepID=A0A532V110_UNCL8|nr:MAG: hypothetical protein CEE37_06700 [candidate division LCP-89 bacterium B3_LCP]